MEILLSTLSCGVLITCFVFVARFWFRSAKAYSNLVKYEYENLPEQWLEDGEPEGMIYWKAPKRSNNIFNRLFRSNPANKQLSWLFFTPNWLDDHPEAQNYLKAMRKNALQWNIGVLSFALLLLLILFLASFWVK